MQYHNGCKPCEWIHHHPISHSTSSSQARSLCPFECRTRQNSAKLRDPDPDCCIPVHSILLSMIHETTIASLISVLATAVNQILFTQRSQIACFTEVLTHSLKEVSKKLIQAKLELNFLWFYCWEWVSFSRVSQYTPRWNFLYSSNNLEFFNIFWELYCKLHFFGKEWATLWFTGFSEIVYIMAV